MDVSTPYQIAHAMRKQKMALIPQNDDINHLLNNVIITEPLRPYLGLSQIGNGCHRFLQYYHYWCFQSSYSNRVKRLFGVGHSAEETMIADLKKVGINVTNQQQSIVATGGHWRGHTDGSSIWGLREYLVEFKTHNDKSFKDLIKKKVKLSKPGHYGQCQSYMGYLKLKACIYMALNKNDSTYYIEIIEFDPEYFEDSKRKEGEIIMSDVLLPKIGTGTSTWFECKMCDARNVCHKGKDPLKSCRSCEFVDVLDEGKWACTKSLTEKILSVDEQRAACYLYEVGDIFK